MKRILLTIVGGMIGALIVPAVIALAGLYTPDKIVIGVEDAIFCAIATVLLAIAGAAVSQNID